MEAQFDEDRTHEPWIGWVCVMWGPKKGVDDGLQLLAGKYGSTNLPVVPTRYNTHCTWVGCVRTLALVDVVVIIP